MVQAWICVWMTMPNFASSWARLATWACSDDAFRDWAGFWPYFSAFYDSLALLIDMDFPLHPFIYFVIYSNSYMLFWGS
jgi:hypothetical protein